MKWVIDILAKDGATRQIPLEHDYDTEDEASREAEDIADKEFTEDDLAWSVIPVKES